MHRWRASLYTAGSVLYRYRKSRRQLQRLSSGLPADFIKNQIGHSSLRVTSIYTHFEHQQKRNMGEQLLSCTQSGKLYSAVN